MMALTPDQAKLKEAALAVNNNWPDKNELLEYIDLANPAAILAILAQLEQVQGDADRYRWMRRGKARAYTCRETLLDKVIDGEIAAAPFYLPPRPEAA